MLFPRLALVTPKQRLSTRDSVHECPLTYSKLSVGAPSCSNATCTCMDADASRRESLTHRKQMATLTKESCNMLVPAALPKRRAAKTQGPNRINTHEQYWSSLAAADAIIHAKLPSQHAASESAVQQMHPSSSFCQAG